MKVPFKMVTFLRDMLLIFGGYGFQKECSDVPFQKGFMDFFREPVSMFFLGGSSLFLTLIVEKKHLTTKSLNHTLVLQKTTSPNNDFALAETILINASYQQITWEILPVPQDGSVQGAQTWKLHLSDETKPWSPARKITTCRYTNCKTPKRSNPLDLFWQDFQARFLSIPKVDSPQIFFLHNSKGVAKKLETNQLPAGFSPTSLLVFTILANLMVPKAFPIRPVVPPSNLQVLARTIRLMRVNGGHRPWCRCSPRETSCLSSERCASKMMDPRQRPTRWEHTTSSWTSRNAAFRG